MLLNFLISSESGEATASDLRPKFRLSKNSKTVINSKLKAASKNLPVKNKLATVKKSMNVSANSTIKPVSN
jgi:hypothetical protein